MITGKLKFDLTNQRFGKLVVLYRSQISVNGRHK